MLPKIAVVCAAHTQLGVQVTRQLIRSPHIGHIYALSELDIRDDPSISSLPNHFRKLTLLVHPLDFLERTVSASIREVDLAFCCLCSPRHVLPSLGAYLFHKLNFDIPLRFVQQMTRMQAHSVAIFSHPSASPTSRSDFLRVKGDLVHTVRKFQYDKFPSVPRVAVFEVPILLSDFRRPLEHHATDHMHNGAPPPPLSAFDHFKQKAVLKHHADTSAPVHIRDAAYALVADAVHSLDTFVRDDIQARQDAQLFITLDPSTIVELANAARALRKKRISTGAKQHAMRDKMSNFAKRELQAHHTSSSSHPSSPNSPSPDTRNARNTTTTHSVDALGAQIARNVSVLADNPLLPDVEADKYGRNKPRRTQSHHERTRARKSGKIQEGIRTPPLASPPRGSLESAPSSTPRRFSQASSPRAHRPRTIRSFHASTSHQRERRSSVLTDRRTTENTDGRRRQGGRFAAVLSALTDKVFSATDRPNVRRARQKRELDYRRRNSAIINGDSPGDLPSRHLPIRGKGDLRAVGQTTI